MSALSRASFLSLAFALALDPACAGDGATLGGFICAQPFAPPCADQPATYQEAETIAACQRDVDRFVVATAAYRDCLERQLTGTVRQANDVLDSFRCLSRRDCPPVAKPKQAAPRR
jgi:hypothetical protein